MTKISEQVEERELKCTFSGSMRPSPAGHEILLLCRPSQGPARCPLSVSRAAQTQRSRLSRALSWHSGLPGEDVTLSAARRRGLSHVPNTATPAAWWKSSKVKPTRGSSEEHRGGGSSEFSTDSRRVPVWRTPRRISLLVTSEDKWEFPRGGAGRVSKGSGAKEWKIRKKEKHKHQLLERGS